jgi:hypothetical protein
MAAPLLIWINREHQEFGLTRDSAAKGKAGLVGDKKGAVGFQERVEILRTPRAAMLVGAGM